MVARMWTKLLKLSTNNHKLCPLSRHREILRGLSLFLVVKLLFWVTNPTQGDKSGKSSRKPPASQNYTLLSQAFSNMTRLSDEKSRQNLHNRECAIQLAT